MSVLNRDELRLLERAYSGLWSITVCSPPSLMLFLSKLEHSVFVQNQLITDANVCTALQCTVNEFNFVAFCNLLYIVKYGLDYLGFEKDSEFSRGLETERDGVKEN